MVGETARRQELACEMGSCCFVLVKVMAPVAEMTDSGPDVVAPLTLPRPRSGFSRFITVTTWNCSEAMPAFCTQMSVSSGCPYLRAQERRAQNASNALMQASVPPAAGTASKAQRGPRESARLAAIEASGRSPGSLVQERDALPVPHGLLGVVRVLALHRGGALRRLQRSHFNIRVRSGKALGLPLCGGELPPLT